jgi:hypothetical protein
VLSRLLGFKPAPRLEKVDNAFPSDCRIASIGPNHAMIVPHDANPKPDGIFGKDIGFLKWTSSVDRDP